MNRTIPVPVFVPKDISAFFSRHWDFYRDSDREADRNTDRSKYEWLIKFIHVGPHRDIYRDRDRWETRRNHLMIALNTGTFPIKAPMGLIQINVTHNLYLERSVSRCLEKNEEIPSGTKTGTGTVQFTRTLHCLWFLRNYHVLSVS